MFQDEGKPRKSRVRKSSESPKRRKSSRGRKSSESHQKQSHSKSNSIHSQKSNTAENDPIHPSKGREDFRSVSPTAISTILQDIIVNNNNNDDPDYQNQPSSSVADPIVFQEVMDEVMDINDPNFNIVIERDYSGKLNGDPMKTRFNTNYPTVLESLVTQEEFQNTLMMINRYFEEAEKSRCKSMLESILWYMTCTLINMCRKSRLEKAMDEIAVFLYNENDRIYHPRGLHVVHPLARGLRLVAIRSIAGYGLYEASESDGGHTANGVEANAGNVSLVSFH